MFLLRQLRIFREDGQRVFAGLVEHFEFLGDVGHFEFGQAVLAGAEEFAGATELEVHFGDVEAVGGFDHGFQSLLGGVGGGIGDEEAGGGVFAAADAAAELVELGEAEAVGVVDEDHAGIGDVDADFDHGGGDEHVGVAVAEGEHRGLFFFGGHLAVQNGYAQAAQGTFGEAVEFGFDGFVFGDAVVIDLGEDNVGLAATGDLLADEVVGLDRLGGAQPSGFDRLAAGGKVVDGAEIEVGEIGEGQRARDGSGGHHEVVRGVAFALEGGALFDAELVLFIDDDEAEVGEFDVFLDEGLGADGEMDFAGGEVFEDGAARFALGAAGVEADFYAAVFE